MLKINANNIHIDIQNVDAKLWLSLLIEYEPLEQRYGDQ